MFNHGYFKQKNPLSRDYAFCGQTLRHSSSQPYLGVQLDSKLSWGEHVGNTAAKANRTLGFLRRNLWFCPKEVKTTAYSTLVRPLLEYASCTWDPHKTGQVNKLEGIQRKAARFCVGDFSRSSSVTQMLADLKWETLEKRRERNRLNMLFKIQKGMVGIPADKYITYLPERRTRKKNDMQMQIPFARTDTYKNSFFVRTPTAWNKLENNIVKAQSLESIQSVYITKVSDMQCTALLAITFRRFRRITIALQIQMRHQKKKKTKRKRKKARIVCVICHPHFSH